MAESCSVSFGRYLRTLRTRRGLSLDDVASRSRAFPEQIGKAYLSRCENGRQRVAFSKLIALSRIYDVPVDVFVERMELDLELDRIGGPATDGLGFAELTAAGRQAGSRGDYWPAYALFRDALRLSAGPEVEAKYQDGTEQANVATMHFTIPAARLGRHRLALHELHDVASLGPLRPQFQVTLLELLGQRYTDVGDLRKAAEMADRALQLAERLQSRWHLAYVSADKAHVCRRLGRLEEAVELLKQASPLFQAQGLHHESAKLLASLAQVYLELGRTKAAKRAVLAAERLAVKHNLPRVRASTRIVSGRIAEAEGNTRQASALWREAVDRSKKLNDHIRRFQAEFFLYRNALNTGDTSTAASLERLLDKHSAWMPKTVDEVSEFRAMRLALSQRRIGFPARNL